MKRTWTHGSRGPASPRHEDDLLRAGRERPAGRYRLSEDAVEITRARRHDSRSTNPHGVAENRLVRKRLVCSAENDPAADGDGDLVGRLRQVGKDRGRGGARADAVGRREIQSGRRTSALVTLRHFRKVQEASPLFEKRKSLQPFRIGARSQIFGAPSQDLLANVD